MKVKIFRQRVSQVHEGEIEINDWLDEEGGGVQIRYIEQSTYLTPDPRSGSDNAQPSYMISVWYDDA